MSTEGLVVFDLPNGTRLAIGKAVLEVTQIGRKCHTGCAILQKAGDCVMPRQGVFVKVIIQGWSQPGDGLVMKMTGYNSFTIYAKGIWPLIIE